MTHSLTGSGAAEPEAEKRRIAASEHRRRASGFTLFVVQPLVVLQLLLLIFTYLYMYVFDLGLHGMGLMIR